MKIIKSAIVVVAYNRKETLLRLLECLQRCFFPEGTKIDLILSIDYSDKQVEIIRAINSIKWNYGEFRIVAQPYNLGLKNHILECGNYVYEYDFITMLEDDLYVSKYFFEFLASSHYYSLDKPEICGVALYSPRIDECSLLRFEPIQSNGNNIFYAQLPCSWGQSWNRRMWDGFKTWYEENSNSTNDFCLPHNVGRWSKKSWKKVFVRYMIENDKYFIYPYQSYSTNFGSAGEHMKGVSTFQVVLKNDCYDINVRANHNIISYDSYLEVTLECCKRIMRVDNDLDFIVNTKCQKNIPNNKLQLTTMPLKNVVNVFSSELYPIEENLRAKIKGSGLYLGSNPKVSFFHYLYLVKSYYKIPLSKGLFRRLVRSL